MLSCDVCGSEFKNQSGLSGHKRLAHPTDPITQAVRQSTIRREDDHLLERLEPLLDRMVQQRVAEHSSSTGQGNQEVEYICHTCHVLIDEAENAICERCGEEKRKQGVSEANDYFRSIPGVVTALEFHEEQEDRNKRHPAKPVITDWSLVPGVKELLENYQAENSVISITKSPSEYIEAEAATHDGMRPVRLKTPFDAKQVPVPAEGYTQLIKIKQGNMEGRQLYMRPQDMTE